METRRVSLSIGTMLILGAGALALAPSCTTPKSTGNVGQAQLQIINTPSNAACIGITVTGSTVAQSQHGLTEGQSTIFQEDNLPIGDVIFTAKMFAEPCTNVTATSAATWVSDPAPVTLEAGDNPTVLLVMHKSTGAAVAFDVKEGQCLPEGEPCDDDAQCCTGLCQWGKVCQLADLSGGLADLPDTVKANDFRVNPPIVKDISVESVAVGTLMRVQFLKDPRLRTELTIFPDGKNPLILHDDGKEGDDVAGDFNFAALAPASLINEIKHDLAETAATLENNKQPLTLPLFDGRIKIGDMPVLVSPDAAGRLHALLSGTSVVIDAAKSLLINNLSVVQDPTRTFDPCAFSGTGGTPMGEWTFGHLMTQMANANPAAPAQDPSDFVEMWLKQWLVNQTVNGFIVPDRNAGMASILAHWPRLASGRLDLAHAPMRLLAIVNRIDLGSNPVYGGGGSAGEGRFVFGVLDPATCAPMQFTVILEYGVPLSTCPTIQSWARDWVSLSTLPFGAPFNAALASLTNVFTHANANPAKRNGSAINQVRTDEFELASSWELREFRLDLGGSLAETTVKQTPDVRYNGTILPSPGAADLGHWISLHQTAVCVEKHAVGNNLDPVGLGGFPPVQHFLGGATENDFNYWDAPGLSTTCCGDSASSRFHFSVNTCDGCHGAETQTHFLHVGPRSLGGTAPLSGFLTGITVQDPAPIGSCSTSHTFGDLARRAVVLDSTAHRSCFTRFGGPLLSTH